jgi:peptidyl-prolyl cis-trans isomerase C
MHCPNSLSKTVLSIFLGAVLLTACNFPGRATQANPSAPGETQAPLASSAPSDPSGGTPSALPASPLPPSPTPLPAALRVNGLEVSQPEYEAVLAQFKAANGGAAELTAEDRQQVVDGLVDEALLAQAAAEQGFVLEAESLQQRLEKLEREAGGPQAMQNWLSANGYTPESFRLALKRSLAAAWLRDQIAAQVPTTAEQVHVRQILLYNAASAAEVLGLLKSGNSFENLAVKYDPVTRGDLGWAPQGYLLDPKLEQAVFALQPGAFSEVIQTAAGYHIVQVLARQQRPLTPDVRLKLQTLAVQNWLKDRRSQAQIELMLP